MSGSRSESMSDTTRCVLLVVAGLGAFAGAQAIGHSPVGTGLLALACALVFIAVAIPTGALIESHTGERLVKWIWFVVLGFFAVGTFVSFYGVGEASHSMARQLIERGEQDPTEKRVGDMNRGVFD